MELTEDNIRNNWEQALRQVKKGTDLSYPIQWSFSDNDIFELAKLYKRNKFRKKIWDLLEDCNFHTECGDFAEGNFDKYIK